ncbi:MAG TPA: hypothetical protein VMA77_18725 [Solirubrobacteraceae bacterium]|nr:hypothetical protein [Solirubrobacteraceae bacterium]
MVPNAYHSFFSASASVAGALIGLLFVAISVAPHKMAGDRASVAFQIGAGSAFAALLNTLIIALAALLPGENLGQAGVILSAIAISSIIGLAIFGLRTGAKGDHPAGLIRLAALLVVFALQLLNGLNLLSHTHDPGPIHTEAALFLALFVIAIDRAWELVDARETRLLPLLAGLLQRSHPQPPASTDQPPAGGH